MAKIFDPLGIISPVTFQIKVLFQEVCKQKIDWDDPLPTGIKEDYASLCIEHTRIEHVKIPKSPKLMGMNNIPSVLSGGHQVTILEPALFILYVNDLSSEISSTVKLYSDDNKVSREISDSTKYMDALQSDLVRLKGRSDTW